MKATAYLAIVLYGLINPVVGQNVDYLPGKYPGRVILSWDQAPATSRTVTWWTDNDINHSYAQLIASDASPDLEGRARRIMAVTKKIDLGSIKAAFHSVRLDSLLPNTVYAYRVGSDNHWSEWFQFKTIDDQNRSVSFIYLGDAQNDTRSLWSRAIREAYSASPQAAFMLHAGDLVDDSKKNNEWGEWFYGGGWILATMSQILIPGNHEYMRNETGNDSFRLSDFWRNSFSLPYNGPEGLEETAFYFDLKDMRFISLDSRDMLIGQENSRKQADWLEKVLQENDRKWVVVSHHHPIYSARGNRSGYAIQEYLQPLYERYDVDLVLQGHHHSFARGRAPEAVSKSVFRGPMYYVSNSGPKMYDTNFASWMERVATNVQLYHLVEISGQKITVDSYLVNGELYDKIELTKNPDGSKSFREIMIEEVEERLDFSTSSYGADIDTSAENREAFRRKAAKYLLGREKKTNP